MEMFRFFDESDAFRSSVTIGRDPLITCYPTLPDAIKAFGHPKLDQAQELLPLNERSILDCGEDELDEIKHAAENSVIAADIDPSRFNEVDAFAVRINEHGSEPTYDLLINQGMAAVIKQPSSSSWVHHRADKAMAGAFQETGDLGRQSIA